MVKKVLAYSYVYLILLLMYVPILVLIVFSFTNATYIGTWNGFSFDLYVALFESSPLIYMSLYLKAKKSWSPLVTL